MNIWFNASGVIVNADGVIVCDECPCPTVIQCDNCDGGVTPEFWDVTFSGVVEGSCGLCDDFNTTWRIPQYDETGCYWRLDIDFCFLPNGAAGYIEVRIIPSTGMQLQVVYESELSVPAPARWTDSSTDCTITHNPTFQFQSVLTCNFSGATAQAVPIF